jgi:hypothetical protein
VLRQDSQTVPVTVTVHLPRHHPSNPGDLPFTGAPIEAFTAAGVVLGLTGALLAAAFRRKSRPARPAAPAATARSRA